MTASRTRRVVYRIVCLPVLLVMGATGPAVCAFWLAQVLDVAARRWLLGADDPYPNIRELLEWA